MAGSANVGTNVAMFEAIHGSAPDIAGQKIANPSGLLNAAIMLLSYVGKTQIADTIKNAWLATLEQGYHTADVFQETISKEIVSTSEFADRIIENLGNKPVQLPESNLSSGNGKIVIPNYVRKEQKQVLVGGDVFINCKGKNAFFYPYKSITCKII